MASFLVAPYSENLAYLSPKEHTQVLEQAFSIDHGDWFLPPRDLQRMVEDTEFAGDLLRERRYGYRNFDKIIQAGVMFD